MWNSGEKPFAFRFPLVSKLEFSCKTVAPLITFDDPDPNEECFESYGRLSVAR